MPSCAIVTCKHRSDLINFHTNGITFHRFPSDPEVKEKWITATCRGPIWWPSKRSTICSVHFRENQFRPLPKSRRLFDWAVPTLKLPQMPTTPSLKHETTPTSNEALTKPSDVDQPILPLDTTTDSGTMNPPAKTDLISPKHEIISTTSNIPLTALTKPCDDDQLTLPLEMDFNETIDSGVVNPPVKIGLDKEKENVRLDETPRKRKMRIQLDKYKIAIQQKNRKIRSLQRQTSRYRKKIADLKEIMKELREKNLVNSDQEAHLENLGVTDLLERYERQQSTSQSCNEKYSLELRTFACTLHFYSPKAYNYVRQKFQSCLPHVRTIRRWYETIDSDPGFTKESFEALKMKVSNTEYKLLCNLVVDEMAIRQRVEWDGKQMYGYVDICNATKKGDCLPEAKEALVFLVTAINGSFKIPVGYFLVDGVTGEQRANLVSQCIELLQETGVEITSLTFDGCPANLSMAKELGCSFKLDDFKTHFESPATHTPVYIFPDPCHMLKLLRNAFEAYDTFVDESGKEVKWAHLKQLNNIQENEKFHLANKLRRNHIFFKNQKMKVRLASQLFSNSVADALIFCAELSLPGFENVDGTVKFLKMINNLFDILNSRHMAQLHFKKPLCADNKAHIFGFLSTAESYLLNLKQIDGTSVIESSRKTGFIGFLACINSLKALYIQLVEKEKKRAYFPTYKISQDHLELLFGQIRSHGGCNSNPTARQFQAIYKKLMVKSELRDVESGNCKALEKVSLLTCSSAVKNINATVDARVREEDDDYENIKEMYEMAVFDEEIDVLVQDLSEFSVQTINYIAGFVVHALMRTLKCETCISALLADHTEDPQNKFIKLKDKGGLIYPSSDVYIICKNMEVIIKSTVLAQDKITVTTKNLKATLTSKALPRFIGMNIFKKYDFHQYDQSPMDNHLVMLIKAVMERYINVRLHYLTKNAVPKLSKRQVLNKYLHFTGQ